MGAFAHGLRERCDWQVIALARSSIALCIAVVLVLVSGKQIVLFRPGVLWLRSLAGSVSLVCTFYAFTRLPMADVFTLTNMVPLWVAMLSWLIGPWSVARGVPQKQTATDRGLRTTLGVWLCVGAGVTGVALIQQPHLSAGNFGTVAAFVSSFFSAVAMLGLNRLGHIDHRAIVVHFSAVATAVCVAALFVCEQQHPYAELLDGGTILCLLATGVSAAVGQLFLTRAYADGIPSKVAVVGLSQIVLSLLLDVVLFRHAVNGLTLLGMALVVGPTAWVLLRAVTPEADLKTSEQVGGRV